MMAKAKPGKGRSCFKDAWLGGEDANGDSPRLYVQQNSMFTFKCTWCQSKDLAVDNIGRIALVQHAKTKKHRDIANIRAGRDPKQVTFNVAATNVVDVESNNNDTCDTESEVKETSEAGSGNVAKKGIKDFFKSADKTTVFPPPEPKVSLENQALKAEIKIALKAIEADWSYNSLDNVGEFLADIAPDSKILQKIQMKSSKLSYVISHGLGPFFHSALVKDLQMAPSFTLGLDSATTKQGGLSKSLDFKVRYFSERFGMVCTPKIGFWFCSNSHLLLSGC